MRIENHLQYMVLIKSDKLKKRKTIKKVLFAAHPPKGRIQEIYYYGVMAKKGGGKLKHIWKNLRA